MCALFSYSSICEHDDEICAVFSEGQLFDNLTLTSIRNRFQSGSVSEELGKLEQSTHLCAIKTLVLCLSSRLVLIFRISSVSVYVSSADVYKMSGKTVTERGELTASSKNRIGESFSNSLATASRCFSPPLIIRLPKLIKRIHDTEYGSYPRSPT